MSQHTKGPWLFSEATCKNGPLLAIETCVGAGDVAGIHGGSEEDYANARLIAAAPDLLSACREAMDMCDSMEYNSYMMRVRDDLAAAIAKAEGGVL